MKIKNISSTLLAAIYLVTLFPDRGRSQPSPDFLAFCSTVRDEYISNFKHKYQNQRYSGSGGAGFRINFKDGFDAGGKGSYDWQRTWDETNSNQKSEYESKNCDEVLKQWGQVSVAEIQANAQEAIARIQNEGYKYGEDTKRLVADIELEGLKDTNNTAQNIATTNANAAQNITATNASASQNIAKTQARANTTSAIVNSLGTVIGNSITSSNNKKQQQLAAQIERERIAADLEKARIAAQIEREKLIASNSSDVSSVDRLLAQWNWTRVSCSPSSVFISGLSNESVCVSPTNLFPPGEYAYDRATNQLVLLNYPPPTNPIHPYSIYNSPSDNIILPATNSAPQTQIIETPATNSAPQSSDYPDSSI